MLSISINLPLIITKISLTNLLFRCFPTQEYDQSRILTLKIFEQKNVRNIRLIITKISLNRLIINKISLTDLL